MNWKEFVRDYLTFTRRDRIAIIAMITLIGTIFFLPTALSIRGSSKPATPDTEWVAAMKKIETKELDNNQQFNNYNEDNSNAYQYDRSTNNYYSKSKGQLFYFDPNTLPTEGWQKLGLRDKTISTIQNYLSKGGKFRKAEDLQRIYGLFPNEFDRIAPYIKIESGDETNGYKDFAEKTPNEKQPPKTYATRYVVVDINIADTTALIALPGIGSKLATRIITFRDKLGGFYSVAQVGETYGLPDSTFQKIKQYLKLENIPIRKININTATIDELKAHPYIRYSLANPIIAYRNQHGAFAKLEDIMKVMVVTDEVFNKIAPYITIQ
jgi:competence ComEA-like helix-hairpin-helix protein